MDHPNAGNYAAPGAPPYMNESLFILHGVFRTDTNFCVKDYSKNMLRMEISAFFPWSWPEPHIAPLRKLGLNGAKKM